MLVIGSCGDIKKAEDTKTEEIGETKSQEVNYLDAGQQLAMKTKSSLASHLVAAIGEKGPEGAVEFCNIKAIPNTDSMSLELNAHIKGVSDKPRNPANQANEAELAYIKAWKEAKAKGLKFAPKVIEINDKMVGYYPIITNEMCMQCHGKPNSDIKASTLENINNLYPNDMATGYKLDEIRGIFVVEMSRQLNK